MKFLCLLCVLCGSSLSALALDREAFTITKYDLAITVEPQQQRLGARGKITLRNDSTHPRKVAVLQISSSLDWRSVRVDGKSVQYVTQPYMSDIDHTGALSEAIVTLPVEIKPQDSVELEIGYEGVIPLDTTRLTRVGVPEGIAKHSSWDQISSTSTAVRGAGYVAWYPITTESADFSEGNSLFEVTNRWKAREAQASLAINLCVEMDGHNSPTVVMNEPSHAEGTGGTDDHRTCTKYSFEPLGTLTPTFAIAAYTSNSKPPLNVLSLPGHEAGAITYSNALEPAMKFVTAWFGQPTAAITIADFADPNSAPFESGTLLMASMAAEDSKLAGINVVHELVHSALPSSRPWVYEGLAHFAEAMYRQQQGGREAALEYLGAHRAAFLESEKEVSAGPQNFVEKNGASKNSGQPLVTTFDETYYRSKAAYVWWMLRDMIGDDALKQAIANYRAADDKDPKYVERLIEATSKRDLTWFFDDWVYQDRGLPDLRVQAAHPWKTETEKAVQFITVTLENLGNAGAEVPFTITYEGGEITKRMEVRARSKATTRVELTGAPSQITVNDGSVPESDLTNNVFTIPAPSSEPHDLDAEAPKN